MEAEYSLPQQTTVMNIIPEEDHRRIQPEAYASSAIYTELNYQVCNCFCNLVFKDIISRD